MPESQFYHQVFFNWAKLKRTHPEATIRIKNVDRHQIKYALWGRKYGGRYEHAVIYEILHPIQEPNKPYCDFVKRIQQMGNPIRLTNNVFQVQQSKCPVCGVLNTVSRANVYLRCQGCGKPLMAVKIRRR